MQESKKVSFRLPVTLLKRLSEEKWMRRKSVTAVLIEALESYFKEQSQTQYTQVTQVPESVKVFATNWPI
jgi:hypothetical protein